MATGILIFEVAIISFFQQHYGTLNLTPTGAHCFVKYLAINYLKSNITSCFIRAVPNLFPKMSFKIVNIVMADDDQDDVDLFQLAIDESCSKLSLTVAMDGTKLMKLLNSTPAPDAIFLDLNMLGKSGKDCLGEIRSQARFDAVPVIILSTSNRKSEIDHCLNNGANHYFVKPNNSDGLQKIIMDLCNDQLTIETGAPFGSSQKEL